MRQRLSIDDYTAGILAGDRIILSRAITVIESRLAEDKKLAASILKQILPHSGNALRVGITGVPGVGKSTFIESFGSYLTAQGKHVAVLTIDPTSRKSQGSILGDKTRMEELAHDPLAFIRPSPTGLSLGGVARSTREAMLVCEAAGYEIILVETVGVGQSETLVKGMTDFFLLLMLARAGDELQGIKKGIMEMADTIAINKADGDNKAAAEAAILDYRNALHLFQKPESGYFPTVTTCSALEKTGMAELWQLILNHQSVTQESGYFTRNRQHQNLEWMHSYIRQTLDDQFYTNNAVKLKIGETGKAVFEGHELPVNAAQELLNLFFSTFSQK